MTSFALDQSLAKAKKQVAQALLEQAGDITTKRRQVSQRDMAVLAGTNWEMVHASLDSLRDEGAIRIERHRIIINEKLLQKVAAG